MFWGCGFSTEAEHLLRPQDAQGLFPDTDEKPSLVSKHLLTAQYLPLV